MTLEQRIREEIERFQSAVYGEDVRESYAKIAEIVCIDAMKGIDHVVEQGNYAERQGDYAKGQGDYAKEQGELAGQQKDDILQAMLKIQAEFDNIKEDLNSTENGALLLEINNLLKDMYRMATDDDIDKIISGAYADEDNEGSIFEAGTSQDIDDIIGGIYSDYEEEPDDIEQQLIDIVNSSFEQEV